MRPGDQTVSVSALNSIAGEKRRLMRKKFFIMKKGLKER
jgi:hypothetical protein